MRVFTCQQCEYSSSGSDVSVNAVIIPWNWGAIPFFGASPLRRYCPPIPRNDDRIHRYILPRTTVFPQFSREFSVSLLHILLCMEVDLHVLCIIGFQILLGSNESAMSASFIFLELNKLTCRKFLFILIITRKITYIFCMDYFTIFHL